MIIILISFRFFVVDVSCACVGLLCTAGQKVKSWRERWFKLDALGYLHYYKTPTVGAISPLRARTAMRRRACVNDRIAQLMRPLTFVVRDVMCDTMCTIVGNACVVQDSSPLDSLWLEGAQVRQEDGLKRAGFNFAIVLVHPKQRVLYLSAQTAEERREWTEAILMGSSNADSMLSSSPRQSLESGSWLMTSAVAP